MTVQLLKLVQEDHCRDKHTFLEWLVVSVFLIEIDESHAHDRLELYTEAFRW